MKILILGLSGRMGCGKTTIAEHLKREHGFIEYSFAEPLKEMVCALLQIDQAELERLKRSEEGILPERGGREFPAMRRTLQTLGTEWGRELIHPELWLAIARRRLERLAECAQPRGIVISDVRFENEADFVRWNGGVVVHVHQLQVDAPLSTHVSEQALCRASDDLELHNNGSLQELYLNTDKLLHRLQGFAQPRRGAA